MGGWLGFTASCFPEGNVASSLVYPAVDSYLLSWPSAGRGHGGEHILSRALSEMCVGKQATSGERPPPLAPV